MHIDNLYQKDVVLASTDQLFANLNRKHYGGKVRFYVQKFISMFAQEVSISNEFDFIVTMFYRMKSFYQFPLLLLNFI